jgi:poly(ADP-ribose) glycohydrolase ARH3
MERKRLRDKFCGTLLGVAVGDALGAPFERMSRVPPERLAGLVQDPGLLRYTDDTHMTLGLAESLVACRGFNGAHMAETFVRNFEVEPRRGYGSGPPEVFRLLRQGVSWDRAGRTLFSGAGSFGNGAAMRVAPAALFAFPNPGRAAQLARDAAMITHTHQMGVEGAALQACAVTLLLHQMPFMPIDTRNFLIQLTSHLHLRLYVNKLVQLEALLPDASHEQVLILPGNGIAAYEAVPAALYAFLRYPNSFSAAVTYAISLGGDTDTIASMTGALAGAYLGEKGIPPLWRARVEGAPHLRQLANAILNLVMTQSHCGDEAKYDDFTC